MYCLLYMIRPAPLSVELPASSEQAVALQPSRKTSTGINEVRRNSIITATTPGMSQQYIYNRPRQEPAGGGSHGTVSHQSLPESHTKDVQPSEKKSGSLDEDTGPGPEVIS